MTAQFIVHSLYKTIEIVVCDVKLLTLPLVFLIVNKVETEYVVIPVLPEGLQSLTLVFMIYDKCFEVEKVKLFIDRRQFILPSTLFWRGRGSRLRSGLLFSGCGLGLLNWGCFRCSLYFNWLIQLRL